MKRLHLHISTSDMDVTKRFYTALFGQAPTVDHPDYMKWMLDDPNVNIAVSQRDGATRGVDHVGIQVDSDEALEELNSALQAAEQSTLAEPGANCCYANSNKHWTRDPQGVVWEMFHTMSGAPTYGCDMRDGEDWDEAVTNPIPDAAGKHVSLAASRGGCCTSQAE